MIEYLGNAFTAEDYLLWSRIQGSLWTAADVLICLYLIRLANLVRPLIGLGIHRLPYLVLFATLPFAAFIPVVPSGGAFFRLELAVTIPHFLIILYILAINIRHARPILKALGISM